MKKSIVIGAGQIGRGFIGELLFDAGYEVVFFDTNKEVIEKINRYKEYRVVILGEESTRKMITGVRAVSSLDDEVVEEMVDAKIITTAVGPNVIPRIAPLLAKGIRLRYERNITEPLTIIACENMNAGTTVLYNCVKEHLTEEELLYCETYVGFPDAEVSRIVVPVEESEPLLVKVEKYMEWVVDETKIKGDLSDIKGMTQSKHVEAYVQRKIFTLTGHAMLGYLGYEKGLDYIWQAVYDPEIFQVVYGALEECGRAWAKDYGMELSEFMEYSSFMMVRFGDQRILDLCTRPCREPIRKLSASERFFGPALTAMKYEIPPTNIIKGIKAVLNYNFIDDKEAVELQKKIEEVGTIETLVEITKLEVTHPIFELIGE